MRSSSWVDCCREAAAPVDMPEAPADDGVEPAMEAMPVAAMACSMAARNISEVIPGLDGVGRAEEEEPPDADEPAEAGTWRLALAGANPTRSSFNRSLQILRVLSYVPLIPNSPGPGEVTELPPAAPPPLLPPAAPVMFCCAAAMAAAS